MNKKTSRKNVGTQNGFDEWGGYMDAKKSKLEEQFAADALKNPYKESNLFTGISIFVNGLTNPSAAELKRIMMTHGGVFHTYQRSSTTFIIATNLPDVKIRQITSEKIINPQWVVDCLKANKILDYSNYLLYTNCKVLQPKITFKRKDIEAVETSPQLDQNLFIGTEDKFTDEVYEEPKSGILLNLNILNTAIRRESQIDDNETREQNNPIIKHQIENKSKLETKSDVKPGQALTAVDPNFLTEFYNNSRLHHIATLGASFKHFISKLRESHNGKFPKRDQLKQTMQLIETKGSSKLKGLKGKQIMHIDMDCFFVSVGLRSRPHLRGFPVAVTHSKGYSGNNIKNINGADRKTEMELYVKRHEDKYKINQTMIDDSDDLLKKSSLIDSTTSLSEIASCSYEARKMGIKNGMFVGAALKLCPQLKTISYDFDSYKEVAHILYETITQYTVDVEAVSCDEMYVNLSDVLRTVECSADEFVSYVRNEIIEKTGCPCSAGIGMNRLQARMATKKAKPNGQFHLKVDSVEEYFADISISDLPGVGYSTTQKCNNICLKTCDDLQQMPLIKLQQEFGKKMGQTLYQFCRGIDDKPLAYDQVRKSVSAEVNYGIRFTEEHELNSFLHQLCVEVQNRLNDISAKGKTITLKYMIRAKDAPVETAKFMGHGFCDNVTKSITLPTFTSDLAIISQTVFSIKDALNVPQKELRGIGIQISKLNISHNITNVNAIKNMFEKVQVKQKIAKETISTTLQRNISTNIYNSDRKTTVRKVKSFSDLSKNEHNEFNSNQNLHKIYEELDLNTLSELPKGIHDEVLHDKNRLLKIKINQSVCTKKLIVRKLEFDFNKDEVQDECQIFEGIPLSRMSGISNENIFKSSGWQVVLSSWLETPGARNGLPSSDIQLLSNYLKEFACAGRFHEIMVFLRFLHRKVERMNCCWHRTYHKIEKLVQADVKLYFGPNVTLNAKSTFGCKNCINKL